MAEDNIAVVRSLFDAYNDGDLDRCAALVNDDFELFDAATGQTYHGPEGCRDWLGNFRTALPDARTEVVAALGDGDLVATEHIGRGTHNGPFATPGGTIPPTGRSIEIHIAELYEVRNGKIASLRAFYDSSTVMRQLGLLPPPGSVTERGMTALMGAGVRARRAVGR